MKIVNKYLLTASLVTGLTLPTLGFAGQVLTTSNNTDYPSTVSVKDATNNSLCVGSTKLPGTVTEPHTPNSTTPWKVVRTLCGLNTVICEAQLYMDRDCKTAPIASASLNLTTGQIIINNITNNLHVVAKENGPYAFQIDPM